MTADTGPIPVLTPSEDKDYGPGDLSFRDRSGNRPHFSTSLEG